MDFFAAIVVVIAAATATATFVAVRLYFRWYLK